ncbi:lamin tail domain-containing protein [Gracilimonas sp. BCB1]|uniref:lamin tail domain-containing protein n=1 Tax=Gracilimonas sp. BCB1 TaxID=3152362 RepID=UPI0032D92AC7
MRVLLFVILWGLPCIIFGQSVNFEDDFSDQDISDWTGSIGDFIFTEENGNILLQQNATGAGVSYLSTPSINSVGFWEFFIRFDGFSPSSGNKAEIYLMSDDQDLTSSLNGYKLRGGENGSSDVFRLLRIDNGSEADEVLTGITNISSGGGYRVKITRDASGNWTLEVAEGYTGVLSVEDTGTDNIYTTTSYFGFKNTYSSTRSDLFYYDFKIDIPPVEVTSVSLVSDTEVDVIFSRDIDSSSAQTSDFTLNPGAVNPQSVNLQSSDTARITFPSNIPSGANSLTISDIKDSANETTLADTTFPFFVYDVYQPGDVIINEFMKDPPPGTAEYVELRNTSSRYLNLRNWQLGDNNSLSTISFSNFTLHPDSFVVVSSDTSTLNTFYGKAVYLQASLPAFNNGGDQIRLFNESGSLIDSLQYNADWGGEDVALERRNSVVPSFYQENWGDSPSPGFGTPGFSNQIQPDITPPYISTLEVVDSQTLLLTLSERADTSTVLDQSNYSISQNPEAGATPPPIPAINSVQQIAPDSLRILLDTDLQEYDGNWTLTLNNLTDIFGNSADIVTDFNYYVIFSAEPNQVVINEFMYDPGDGFSEFVELYNHSDSSFSLQYWTFNDNTGSDEFISPESFVLPAGKFVVLAPDSTLTTSFPGIPLIDMSSRFSSLEQ